MDRQEFERLALGHLDAVYRMALQLTRNTEQAEELVQEVYLRAFRPAAINRFHPPSASPGAPPQAQRDGSAGLRSWLFTITHNTFNTMVKRRQPDRGAAELTDAAATADALPDDPPPAWDLASLDWDHVDERLKGAIDRLRPEFRQALLLWGVEGLKYKQIAEMLDVPIGTVMSRLFRARKLLAEALDAPPPNGAANNLSTLGTLGAQVRRANYVDGHEVKA